MERKETFFPVIIEELHPSKLEINSFMQSGLVELEKRAYGREDTYFNLLYSAMGTYHGKDGRKTNYVAKINGKPVGSISSKNWRVDDAATGTKIWQALEAISPEMYRKSLEWPTMCYVTGVIVDPDFRNRGLGGKLYQALVKKTQPSFIWGDTKTPQAVLSRANSLVNLGYRTFYGQAELTPGRYQEKSREHLPIIEADIIAEQFSFEDGFVFWQDTSVLSSYIPDVSSFPDPIKKSFEDLIRAQEIEGKGRTASKPLISIRSDIIPSNP